MWGILCLLEDCELERVGKFVGLHRETIPFHPALTTAFYVRALPKFWGLRSRPGTPYLHAALGLGDGGWGGVSFLPFSFILH